jgi:hypothetical protein
LVVDAAERRARSRYVLPVAPHRRAVRAGAALRRSLGEGVPSATEAKLVANVVKRVRMWRDVEPFSPELPESRMKNS